MVLRYVNFESIQVERINFDFVCAINQFGRGGTKIGMSPSISNDDKV